MNLTATDLIRIGEALRYAADRIRYDDPRGVYDGPQYRRSLEMEDIAGRVSDHLAALPAGVTVEV